MQILRLLSYGMKVPLYRCSILTETCAVITYNRLHSSLNTFSFMWLYRYSKIVPPMFVYNDRSLHRLNSTWRHMIIEILPLQKPGRMCLLNVSRTLELKCRVLVHISVQNAAYEAENIFILLWLYLFFKKSRFYCLQNNGDTVFWKMR